MNSTLPALAITLCILPGRGVHGFKLERQYNNTYVHDDDDIL